ncbi:MAG TPA: lipopolysaccharide heptosyltransferase II [Chthoniobacterales bacterium]|nr:lipopolysaccharide heptosyltransferase II [Chthoniobacterales bacterium]
MVDFCIYLLYRAGTAIFSLIPLRLLFLLGEFLGFVAWFCAGKYRRLAQRNLAIAFGGEHAPRASRPLARRHFQRLGANLLCHTKLSAMPPEAVAARVTLENENIVHDELRAGRGVVLVLSHLGNWELFTQLIPRSFGYVRISTIFQPLGNRYIDADVRRTRARPGVELFDRRAGFHGPIELLRGGGIVGVLADQHAGDHGMWTPFFGRLASTTPLPALLAKRTHAAAIAAAVYTDGRGRWRLVFTRCFEAREASVPALTAQANEVIAEQIRQAPEDWFWVHNRWKTPNPNFLLPKYKRGVYVPGGASAPLQPFRILIRSTNWLGDAVISAAAVRVIKRGRPDAHITIATPAKLAAMWKLIPEVDDIIEFRSGSLLPTVQLMRRRPRFDVAILFPNSLRAALEVWLAGIPRRVGYRGHHRSWLLNQIVAERAKPGPIEHQVHRYLHLAQELGGDISALPASAAPRNYTNGVQKLGLCPGAEYGPAKRWLPERFAEAAAAVAAQRSVQWILFGTSSDGETGRTIAEALGQNCSNRIGQTTLEQLIAELRECRLLLTNDTGTMHLATLLGVPVVAIFGSTENRLTGPLGLGNTVVRHHVECSPCFLRECPIDFRCMKAVTPEEVAAAVLAKL